jgi:hypothetical protein
LQISIIEISDFRIVPLNNLHICSPEIVWSIVVECYSSYLNLAIAKEAIIYI